MCFAASGHRRGSEKRVAKKKVTQWREQSENNACVMPSFTSAGVSIGRGVGDMVVTFSPFPMNAWMPCTLKPLSSPFTCMIALHCLIHGSILSTKSSQSLGDKLRWGSREKKSRCLSIQVIKEFRCIGCNQVKRVEERFICLFNKCGKIVFCWGTKMMDTHLFLRKNCLCLSDSVLLP